MVALFLIFQCLAEVDTSYLNWSKTDIPMRRAFWQTQYDGHGQIVFKDNTLTFAPRPSIANETTAALLLSTLEIPAESFYLKVSYEVIEQYRQVPNSWETLWIFWAYQKNGAYKDTAYLIAKKNGFEVGHAFSETGQNFIFTSNFAAAPEPKYLTKTIEVLKNNGLSFRNNTGIWTHVPDEKIKLIPSRKAPIGLYSEDAKIKIFSVEVRLPSATVRKSKKLYPFGTPKQRPTKK